MQFACTYSRLRGLGSAGTCCIAGTCFGLVVRHALVQPGQHEEEIPYARAVRSAIQKSTYNIELSCQENSKFLQSGIKAACGLF